MNLSTPLDFILAFFGGTALIMAGISLSEYWPKSLNWVGPLLMVVGLICGVTVAVVESFGFGALLILVLFGLHALNDYKGPGDK